MSIYGIGAAIVGLVFAWFAFLAPAMNQIAALTEMLS
jgi:hypothetical protein